MDILKDIIIQDLFLYLPKYKTFIMSDIHIGYEESLQRKGAFIPKNNYNDLILRIERAIENIKKKYVVETIIINGDLIHEFGKISFDEKKLINNFLDFLLIYGDVIILKGNHDNFVKHIVDKTDKNSINKNITIKDNWVIEDILIIHGDLVPKKEILKNIKTIIIGHEHPAINIKSFSKSEKFKCFLKGKYLNKNLIVMPSCNLLIEGTDVLHETLLSPYLKNNDLLNFEAYVIGDVVYDFGKLKKFMK